jgi:hypothetical protein
MVVLHVPASNSTSVPKWPTNQAGLAAILPPPLGTGLILCSQYSSFGTLKRDPPTVSLDVNSCRIHSVRGNG